MYRVKDLVQSIPFLKTEKGGEYIQRAHPNILVTTAMMDGYYDDDG